MKVHHGVCNSDDVYDDRQANAEHRTAPWRAGSSLPYVISVYQFSEKLSPVVPSLSSNYYYYFNFYIYIYMSKIIIISLSFIDV